MLTYSEDHTAPLIDLREVSGKTSTIVVSHRSWTQPRRQSTPSNLGRGTLCRRFSHRRRHPLPTWAYLRRRAATSSPSDLWAPELTYWAASTCSTIELSSVAITCSAQHTTHIRKLFRADQIRRAARHLPMPLRACQRGRSWISALPETCRLLFHAVFTHVHIQYIFS
jgi:hypothetical protein